MARLPRLLSALLLALMLFEAIALPATAAAQAPDLRANTIAQGLARYGVTLLFRENRTLRTGRSDWPVLVKTRTRTMLPVRVDASLRCS